MQHHTYNFIGQYNSSSQQSNTPPPHNKLARDPITEKLNHNKLKAIASIALVSYVLIQGTLLYLRTYIWQRCSWSLWKQHSHCTSTKMAYKLHKKIKQAYPTKTSHFLYTLEKEKQALTHYAAVVNFLKKLSLLRIFYYDQKLYESIERRLARLLYLENCFLAPIEEFLAQKQTT